MTTRQSERYRSWLIGELLLACVLALGTVLLALTGRLDGYALPNARISLDTAVAVVASLVAVLASIRFLVEGRGMDLLLAGGFFAIGAGTFAFAVAPVLSGRGVANGRPVYVVVFRRGAAYDVYVLSARGCAVVSRTSVP